MPSCRRSARRRGTTCRATSPPNSTSRSQLPTGPRRLPMPAVRGLANDSDPAVRQAAYAAEMLAWPQVAVPCAAAMNAIKGEATIVNRRRKWGDPLDASLFANAVSRKTFDAMQAAVAESLADFRRWMRAKAGAPWGNRGGGLKWRDLVAPSPVAPAALTWDEGVATVRDAFADYSAQLGGLVTRALDERWIDAEARDGKAGGAFCMSFIGDRSLVLMNWAGSADSAQTLAHELGHAYHNTTLAERTLAAAAPADGPGRDGEHLLRDVGRRQRPCSTSTAPSAWRCSTSTWPGRTRSSSTSTADSSSRREVFARRAQRTLGVTELNELMLESPGRRLRRRARPVDRPPAHVGAQAALLRRRTSTTGRTPTVCCSGSGCSPATARTRSGSVRATRRCCRGLAWTRPRSSARRSASTSPTRRSGPPASTCSAPGSPTTNDSPPSSGDVTVATSPPRRER